jgi:NADH-quinone oxidoreductase subunit G
VVLPAQAYTEREGTFTSGERRVQRYYPALPARPGGMADFAIAGELGNRLGLNLEARLPSKVMARLGKEIPAYAGLSYQKLAEVTEQWPIVGRGDLYYGGTTYENSQGLGVQIPSGVERGEPPALGWPALPQAPQPAENGLLAVPVTRLYDRGQTVLPSKMLQGRVPRPYVAIHPADAKRLGLLNADIVQVTLLGTAAMVSPLFSEEVPQGMALIPRSLGVSIGGPSPVEIRAIEKVVA